MSKCGYPRRRPRASVSKRCSFAVQAAAAWVGLNTVVGRRWKRITRTDQLPRNLPVGRLIMHALVAGTPGRSGSAAVEAAVEACGTGILRVGYRTTGKH